MKKVPLYSKTDEKDQKLVDNNIIDLFFINLPIFYINQANFNIDRPFFQK